jgi:hypothetical protein
LWIFAIDDLFDDGNLAGTDVQTLAEPYDRIINGCPIDSELAAVPIATPLHDVVQDLSQFELFASLRPIFAQTLLQTVRAMSLEEQWARTYLDSGILPAPSEYLDNGCATIGIRPTLWGITAAIDDPSASAHTTHLAEHIDQAAACVRLANDLRSYRKELAEGNVNSLIIYTAAGIREGQPPERALALARARVESEVADGLAH